MNLINRLILIMHIFFNFQIWATQYVERLPIKMRRESHIPSMSQDSLRKLKEQENNYQEELSWQERLREIKEHEQVNPKKDDSSKENVLIKTNDNDKKIMAIPRWQINEMPALFKHLSHQEKENNVLDYSEVKGGISSQELQLLSDTWVKMREGQALSYINGLPLDSLSVLSGAADKVQSKLLYAVTIDDLVLKDKTLKDVFSGFESTIQKLVRPVITFLEKKEKFIFVEKKREGVFEGINKSNFIDEESFDGTKWIDKRLKLSPPTTSIGLYNKADKFSYKELIVKKLDYFTFRFDSGDRMLFGIPKSESGEFFCFDTQNQYKKYIKYHGYIGDMECFPDGKIIIFTQGKEFGKKRGNELYICHTTEDNPQPYKILFMEKPITAIAVSPNNEKFICVAGEKLSIINNIDGAFIKSSIVWTDHEKIDTFLAEKGTVKADLKPIEKAIFNSSGTKLICISEDPVESCKSLLLLYSCVGSHYVLERVISVEITPHRINCASNVCVISSLFGRSCYWKFDDLSDPVLIVENEGSYTPKLKIKLSSDGQRIIFTNGNDGIVQCRDYPDFTSIILDEEKEYKNVDSIEIEADDEQVSIAYSRPDAGNPYKINVITKRLYFGGPKLTLGGAQVIHNLYYATTELKRFSQIIKGTLSYELFQKLPEVLRNKMISGFGLKVIHDISATSDEEKYGIVAAEEASPEVLQQAKASAIEDVRRYLKESKKVPEEKQEQKAGILQSVMKAVSQMRTYIYEKMSSAIKK